MTIDTSDILLTDRVAVVTGGAAGIGAGIARGLAKVGADVVIADIDTEQAEKTAEELRSLGCAALPVTTDVMDDDAIESMIAAAKERFGRIDILVNNVGGVRRRPFIEQSRRSVNRHVQINLMSMFTATQLAAQEMIAGGRGGAILNVSSIEGLRAAPMYAVYGACKAGMLSFTRSMALELSDHDIRVNALAPDFIETEGSQRPDQEGYWPAEDELAVVRARYVPLRRHGNVDDCAGAAVFLCSPWASYITGETLAIDGGTLASSGWGRSAEGEWSLLYR